MEREELIVSCLNEVYNIKNNCHALPPPLIKHIIKGFRGKRIKRRHDNGQAWYEYYYVNDKREGWYRGWYENGYLQFKSYWINGKREGVQRWWYPNGQLEYECYWINNEKDGLNRGWYFNGSLEYEKYYVAGERKR